MNRLRKLPPFVRALVAVLLAVAAGVTVTVTVDTGGGPPPGPPVVTGPTQQGPITAPAPAVEDAKTHAEDVGLGHETITPRDELHNDREASPRAPRIVGPPPAATPRQAGCVTRENTHNFSYRNGVRPSLAVPHLTVSRNLPGWADVNGVAIFLNRPATQASANYIIDAEGHCLYTVGETSKAWTQGNFNSASACSFEVVNTGGEATYAGTAGLDKLARVLHDCAHRWGIPLRRGEVSGSRVVRSGVVDHFHLGAAGGGHVDIRRFGAGCRLSSAPVVDTWLCVDLIVARARALDGPRVSVRARAQCRELNGLRKAGRRGSDRARLLKRNLVSHGYVCRAGRGGRAGSVVRA